MKTSKGKIVCILIIALLVLDQVTKFLVKTNMVIGEEIPVLGDWFKILFIENRGMAFGMQFGGDVGKFLLTSFRLIFAGFVIVYLRKLILSNAKTGVLVGISLVLVGALGNIVDSLFYGMVFSASTPSAVAEFLPESGGYAPFMMGRVVDMLYFPLIETTLPDWVPIWGGEEFIFFRPIFNIADSCITVGVLYLLIFHRKFLAKDWNH